MRSQSLSRTSRARRLRNYSTWAERLMWAWLRGRRFSKYKFRRQHPVGKFVLDFFCCEANLAIELDGSGHGHVRQRKLDILRDEWLAKKGIKVLRFWNSRLRTDKDTVRQTIWQALENRVP